MVGRVLVSVIAIPLLLGITILGEYWFAICVAGIGVLALYEVYRIIDLWGINTYRLLGLLALLGVLGNAYWNFSTYITIMVVFAFIDIFLRSIVKIFIKGKNNSKRSKDVIKDAEYEIIEDDD